MSCPRCPHCLASGAFGLIDPNDPALTTNQPPAPKKELLARVRAIERDGRLVWVLVVLIALAPEIIMIGRMLTR